MEVSDALNGRRSLQQHQLVDVAPANMTASSSGKRSATATDGEGGDFSDEGLSTVRRVVQQPQKEENDVKTPSGSQKASPHRSFGGHVRFQRF